jgi:hypothetical protein
MDIACLTDFAAQGTFQSEQKKPNKTKNQTKPNQNAPWFDGRPLARYQRVHLFAFVWPEDVVQHYKLVLTACRLKPACDCTPLLLFVCHQVEARATEHVIVEACLVASPKACA